MKVLLIDPSRSYHGQSQAIRLNLPLGPLYVAAVLENNGFDVSVFDCKVAEKTRLENAADARHFGVDDNYFMEVIANEKPDVVGISCMFTAQFDNYLHASKLVKQVCPDIHVVGGGPHFSVIDSDFLLENSDTDCYVSGEGEEPMLAIVKALSENKYLDGIPGVTFLEVDEAGARTVKHCENRLYREMDQLPKPAYHMIDMDLYFRYQLYGCEGYSVPISSRPEHEGKKTISMITSRGCPFRCVFCSIALHMGKPVRAHTSQYIVDHIEHVMTEYSVEHILFEDDNLTFRMDRTREYCQAILERGLQFTWTTPNGVRADKLDYALLEIMKEAGCVGLTVGTESGDQDTLDNIVKKDLKLEDVVQVSKWCKELNIPLNQFLIIGFPGETKEKMQRTIDWAVTLHEQYGVAPRLMFATPLIGTELHDIVVTEGYHASDVSPHSLSGATSSNGNGLISTPEFTPTDLTNFVRQLQERIGMSW